MSRRASAYVTRRLPAPSLTTLTKAPGVLDEITVDLRVFWPASAGNLDAVLTAVEAAVQDLRAQVRAGEADAEARRQSLLHPRQDLLHRRPV